MSTPVEFRYSVVIPHYNSSMLLKRMIASIPEREDVQVIVADDCSKDEEYEAIQKIEHKNLEIYRLDKNGGAGSARNLGLTHVNGEWVTFVDADDTFADGAFNVFDDNIDPKLDYLCYFVKVIDDSTGETSNSLLYHEKIVRKFYENPSNKNKNLFMYRNNVCWNKLVRVDFIKGNNVSFEPSPVNNDVLYTLKIGILGNSYKVVPVELYEWRIQGKSITQGRRSIEREFLFYLQAQKRNGFYKSIGLSYYPFYRNDMLYVLHFLKKRGLSDTIRFFWHKHKHIDEVKKAREAYLNINKQ